MEKVWKDEYVDSLETMKFSNSQKAKITQFLVNADSTGEGDIDMLERKKNTGSLFIKRLAIAGVCVCTLVAGTAGANASGLLKPASEVFGNIFHLSGDTSEIVDKMGNGLSASDSFGGVKITADAVLGDGYNYAVVFSLEREDGAPFDSIMDKAEMDTWGFSATLFEEDPLPYASGLGANYYFSDDNPNDSSVQLVYLMSSDTKLAGKEMTAKFFDLCYYDKTGNAVDVLEGEWNLHFPINPSDSAIKLQAGQHIQADDINMLIQAIQISPIGYHIECEDLDYTENDDFEEEDTFFDTPIVLTLSSGEELELFGGSSARALEEGGYIYTLRGTFDKIIPIDEMKSIRVGDIDIKIAAEPKEGK